MQQNLIGSADDCASSAAALPGFSVGKTDYLPFGVSVVKPAQPEWDVRKELRSKLAWVLGTAYGVDYSSARTAAKIYADRIAQVVLRDHGYPTK